MESTNALPVVRAIEPAVGPAEPFQTAVNALLELGSGSRGSAHPGLGGLSAPLAPPDTSSPNDTGRTTRKPLLNQGPARSNKVNKAHSPFNSGGLDPAVASARPLWEAVPRKTPDTKARRSWNNMKPIKDTGQDIAAIRARKFILGSLFAFMRKTNPQSDPKELLVRCDEKTKNEWVTQFCNAERLDDARARASAFQSVDEMRANLRLKDNRHFGLQEDDHIIETLGKAFPTQADSTLIDYQGRCRRMSELLSRSKMPPNSLNDLLSVEQEQFDAILTKYNKKVPGIKAILTTLRKSREDFPERYRVKEQNGHDTEVAEVARVATKDAAHILEGGMEQQTAPPFWTPLLD